jgi:hypothetical protein
MSNSVLQNKFVLYFVFILAVGNLFQFMFRRDVMSVGIFIAAGILTSFFSKNMTVIMVVAMVVANIIQFGKDRRDGFKSEEKEDEDEEPFATAVEDDDDEDNFATAGGDDDEDDEKDGFKSWDQSKGTKKQQRSRQQKNK